MSYLTACAHHAPPFVLYIPTTVHNVYTVMFRRHHGGDGGPTVQKQQIEFTSPAWLHSSGWDRSLHTVLIVHGYGGATQDYLPAPVLRDGKCTTTATN